MRYSKEKQNKHHYHFIIKLKIITHDKSIVSLYLFDGNAEEAARFTAAF